MKTLYKELLDGSFTPKLDPRRPINGSLSINNNTDISVQPKLWTDAFFGFGPPWAPIGPQSWEKYTPSIKDQPVALEGDCVIFTSVATGAFVSAQILKAPRLSSDPNTADTAPSEFAVFPTRAAGLPAALARLPLPDARTSDQDLVAPNDIGEPPTPSEDIVVPPDSPRIVVAIGRRSASMPGSWNALIHEQYWKRDSSSFYLAPHSSRIVSTSHTSGRVESSSSVQSVSETIGTNVSAGWGPVSASISASLANNVTTSKSVTLTENDSLTMQETFANDTPDDELILFWNLVDVYTWMSSSNVQMAVVEIQQAPTVLRRYRQSRAARDRREAHQADHT